MSAPKITIQIQRGTRRAGSRDHESHHLVPDPIPTSMVDSLNPVVALALAGQDIAPQKVNGPAPPSVRTQLPGHAGSARHCAGPFSRRADRKQAPTGPAAALQI
jgi:hypothetical protein